MGTAVIPAHSNKVTIVHISNNMNYHLTVKELEEIRTWVNDHKDTWPECAKEIQNIFGYDVEVTIYPKVTSDSQHVFLLEFDYAGFPTEQEMKDYHEILDAGLDDDDFIVFTCSSLSIKRINRNLLPFL